MSQAISCVSAPSPNRDCPDGYPRKSACFILAMEATKHDWHHLHDTTITKRIPTQVPSVIQYRVRPQWIDGSILEEGMGDFQIPECIVRMGPRRSHKEGISSKATINLAKTPRVGIGCYRSSMKRCGMTDSEACQWDETEQTAEHKSSRRPACSEAYQRQRRRHGYNTPS